jgi:hypothetical protein
LSVRGEDRDGEDPVRVKAGPVGQGEKGLSLVASRSEVRKGAYMLLAGEREELRESLGGCEERRRTPTAPSFVWQRVHLTVKGTLSLVYVVRRVETVEAY